MSGARRDRACASRIPPSVWKVAVVVSIGSFMAQMDSTLVNVSLAAIGHALHSPIATTQWIMSGYLLAMALILPLNGWLVDRIGAKRLYLFAFSTFTFASVLCGAAQNMGELIAARVFQGLVAGLLAPMAQMMLGRVAGKNLERVMGYATLPILLGPIFGPLLAGAVLARAAWPWLFLINVPVGILGVTLAARLLAPDAGQLQRRPFDFTGFALISPGLVALVYGFQSAMHAEGAAFLLAGAALLAAFVWHALRHPTSALIDVRLFADRMFAVPAITQFFANGIMYGRQFAVALYLIAGCGLSAAHAGWLLAASGAGMMGSFACMGFLTERLGCRALAAGGALLALCATLPFLWMTGHAFSPGLALASLFIAGVGHGTISIPSISAAYARMPKARLPMANTALNIAQRMGGPVATTLVAIAVSLAVPSSSAGEPRQFLQAFAALCGLHMACFTAAILLPASVRRANEG
ncbi:MFS transporter [Paraburkholderia acidiphila]|uniref:MFS transporter n=1 Tax=Paraburkholderia acidiphila TaxID=2571747 RepID=A0A7Z2GD35_9BURK|nr:MFS transporter [Paraburkholderia acidiphila]QGZ59576.1 MFS transporter [Paraburkholderia acidiphila]